MGRFAHLLALLGLAAPIAIHAPDPVPPRGQLQPRRVETVGSGFGWAPRKPDPLDDLVEGVVADGLDTQWAIAVEVGASRKRVVRALRRLERRGLVAKVNRRYRPGRG